MEMKDKVHTLPSFCAYINKAFAFRSHLPNLTDSRHDPEISPQTIFLAMFHSFAFRLPSIQQLETDLASPCLQRWTGAERAFRDDTLRYSLCGFHLEPLEQILVDVNRRLKRAKVFYPGRVQGRIVAALDGVEVLSSFSRCCDACLQRRVWVRDPAGRKVEQIQYYHRAVGCQIVNSPVKPVLALEWLQPGESEDIAALRLLRRLPSLYGSKFFDILLLDALYAQSPVLELAREIGWDLVVSLKQNLPDLYQSAQRLFNRRPPDACYNQQREGKLYEIQLWDTDGLPFTADHPEPVRVVRSEEILKRKRFRNRQKVPHATNHEWVWITTLPTKVFSSATIRKLGKCRWKNENNGWMDLTKHWSFKHGFLHACKHRPKRRSPATGELALVPNQGLPAVALIALIAFSLCAAFTIRHSKLARQTNLPGITIAAQLRACISQHPPPGWLPDSPSP